jgi:hypothetical protein
MKLTKSVLKQIIAEEIKYVLREAEQEAKAEKAVEQGFEQALAHAKEQTPEESEQESQAALAKLPPEVAEEVEKFIKYAKQQIEKEPIEESGHWGGHGYAYRTGDSKADTEKDKQAHDLFDGTFTGLGPSMLFGGVPLGMWLLSITGAGMSLPFLGFGVGSAIGAALIGYINMKWQAKKRAEKQT